MRLSAIRLGHGFGELAYIRGLITYRISPFEQRAFAGFFKSIQRTAYRFGSNALTVVPPFVIGYFIYTETERKFIEMNRKNPADYANDK